MSRNSTRQPKGLEKSLFSARTPLPIVGSGDDPVKALPGAFAAALGGKLQTRPAKEIRSSAKAGGKLSTAETAGRMKMSKPGAPIMPRKGHR